MFEKGWSAKGKVKEFVFGDRGSNELPFRILGKTAVNEFFWVRQEIVIIYRTFLCRNLPLFFVFVKKKRKIEEKQLKIP